MHVASVAVMVRVIVAMVIAVVNIAVAVPTIAMRHARVQRLQLTAIIAVHLAKTQPVQVALQAPSKVMTARVKVVAIRVAADVHAATKVTVVKRAPKALRPLALRLARKRVVPPRRHVSRKAHVLRRFTLHKPKTNCTCKTVLKVNPALKTTTAVIQNVNAVVVVAVAVSAVKTKVQALRTKTVHQACNRQRLTLRQTLVSQLKVPLRHMPLQHLCRHTLRRPM